MRNGGARVPRLHRHVLLAVVVLLVLWMTVRRRHDAVLVVGIAHVWLLIWVAIHAIIALLRVRAVQMRRELRGLGLGLDLLLRVEVLRLGGMGILLCPAATSRLGIRRRVQGSAAVGDRASSHVVCRLPPVATVATVAPAGHGWRPSRQMTVAHLAGLGGGVVSPERSLATGSSSG
jgi:hypothetical protein